MNHKHEAPWLLKKCMLYTFCTLILSNPLHLTIGSNLTKWFKMSFEFQKNFMHILKFIFLMFSILKRCHQDFSLTYLSCLLYFFWVKSSEKWFTRSVISPNPYQFCKETIWMSWTYLVLESLSLLSMSWTHTISWSHINFE
jgi:hypothetical protein